METLNRKFTDSGYLIIQLSSLASDVSFIPDLDERFKPYNDILLINLNSDNDVEVTVNDLSTQILPKANRLQINQIVQTLKIKNIGASTISANQIRIFYRNTGYRGQELKKKAQTYAGLGMDLLRTIRVFR